MPFDPFVTSGVPDGKPKADNLQDALSWVDGDCDLAENTKTAYRGALLWAGKHLRRPLSEIAADHDAVLGNFPDAEYSREWAKTYDAFKIRKRSLSAAINGATGVIAERKERRARADGWSRLIARLRLLSLSWSEAAAELHPGRIIAVEALASLARSQAVDTWDLVGEIPARLYRAAQNKGQRDACVDAIAMMNAVRALDDAEVESCLPERPIVFSRPKKPEDIQIPAQLRDELDIWITVATRGEWSPTDASYGPGVDPGPFRNATNKVIKTAIAIGLFDTTTSTTVAFAFGDKILTEVVRSWRRWGLGADPRAIAARTAKDYLARVKTFLARNGEASDHVQKILKTDQWLSVTRVGQTKMSPRAQRFCRNVVRDMGVRANFLSLHIRYRKAAESHLRKAKACHSRSKFHLGRARKYGTIAAFAAIESDAAPVRSHTTLKCTFRGPNPWLNLGSRKQSDGHLYIPSGETKNKKAISAPISAKSKTHGLDTLRWYEKKIRPLFPHADANDFFFPSVQSPKESLCYSTFKKWWDQTISEFNFPGMNPHMFRHGQASILVANNPGSWNYVMARLGDALRTCMEYYGWIDEERLIEEGQMQLTRDLPNA